MRFSYKIRPQRGGAGPVAPEITPLPSGQPLRVAPKSGAMKPSWQTQRVDEHSLTTDARNKMKSIDAVDNGDRLISAAKLREILGISKATMNRRLTDDPSWPTPVRLGKTRTKRYWLSDVMRYANGAAAACADVKNTIPEEPTSQPVPKMKDENPTQEVQVESKDPIANKKMIGGHEGVHLTQKKPVVIRKNPVAPSRRKTSQDRYMTYPASVKLMELRAQEQSKNPDGDGTDSSRDGGAS